ncbi:response regulator transcription factor [Kutzneria viridogrisea]|uniref:LuxR response regulator receiver n=2 Tax=Kutzneria TaxID=43356 RepID=W5WCF9_9PSEU|nr:response regulator transcription factor [Kutzneria albida]AHH95899.1 LuxR response regulator receiver [Kutzneria albida DSM 43870]MBA8928901.1 DNA-binding NarL/FixJ family response regulator [Kutzneria viridogrisea]
MTAPVSVLIVDDDPLVRAGLRAILAADRDIRVVAEAEDGGQVAGLVSQHAPDVVLMDVRMPGVDGLTATERLCARAHHAQVIMLTSFSTEDTVLRALRAGATGFLLKDTSPAEIVRAVHRAACGEPVLSPAVTRGLIARLAEPAEDEARELARRRLAELGERELAVAKRVGQGKSNPVIGVELSMSVAAVKAHVSRLLVKLRLRNRLDLALLADAAELTGDQGYEH